MAKAQKLTDIDGYISLHHTDVQVVLRDVRDTIRRAAPDAVETISYQMPAFRQHSQHRVHLPNLRTSSMERLAALKLPSRSLLTSCRTMPIPMRSQ